MIFGFIDGLIKSKGVSALKLKGILINSALLIYTIGFLRRKNKLPLETLSLRSFLLECYV